MAKKKMQRWVVKVGSRMVCTGGPLLVRAWMQQVLNLRNKHSIETIWVTSGAIASAVERTDFKKSKHEWSLAEKQALSALGQPMLMDLYNLALAATGMIGAQVLLTYQDLLDSKRRQNFQNTIEQLLKWKTLPLLNENDAVATDEIKFGDNDSLSARVAHFTDADRLIILTDVEGLFDKDPNKSKDARLISLVEKVTPAMLARVSRTQSSRVGTGGMFSKLTAAREASMKGIPATLVKGDKPSVLSELAQGALMGTHVLPKKHK